MPDFSALLEPGALVTHPSRPEWGVGQVQSNINGRITVNFPHQGKVVVEASRVELVLHFGDGDAHRENR